MLFGQGVEASDLNDAIARTLDKTAEAGVENIYSNFALHCFTKFNIPLGDLHGDTTSHTVFGTYDGCEVEDYDGLVVARGFSKEHRPDQKQIMIGNVVTSSGIPIIHQTIDGNTADCSWNGDVLKTLNTVLKDKMSQTIYIADAKLMTMPNIELMADNKVLFISRIPDNFHSKLAAKLKVEAYKNDQWQDLGKIKNDEYHASYQGCSFTRQLSGMKIQFLVVKSSDGQVKFDNKLQHEKQLLERAIKELESQQFSCEPDAKKSADQFQKKHGKGLYSLSFEISSVTSEKRAVGNPGKTPKTPALITTWQVHCSFSQNEMN